MPQPSVEQQETPNPQAMKFIVDRVINPGPTRSYLAAQAVKDDPLAVSLFSISGVRGVMILNDFVTVTKKPSTRWRVLSPRVEQALIEHLQASVRETS